MSSAFNKEIRRSIKGSLGRFIAIVIISFLGAGVFAGLRMSAPNMRLAGDEFFDVTALYDISVISSLGLDDETIEMLESVEGVAEVMAAYRADVVAVCDGQSFVANVESLPSSAATSDTSDGVQALSDDDSYLNRPILLEGSWPETVQGCVMGAETARSAGISIGDTVTFEKGSSDLDDTFAITEFIVSGLVNSSAYVSDDQLGTSTLGGGTIEQYIYVAADAFAADYPYSVAYLTVVGARDETWESPGYDRAVGEVLERIELLGPAMGAARQEAIRAEAQAELDDARAEYEAEKRDARADLATAAEELFDAGTELSDAERKLVDSRRQLEESRVQLADTLGTLDDAEAQYSQGRSELDAQREALQPGLDALPQLRQQRDALAAIPDPTEEQQAQLVALNGRIQEIEGAEAALQAGQARLDETRATLDASWVRYREGVARYRAGVDALNAAVAEYREGIGSYAEGKADYEAGVTEAEQGFADAEAELADAQAKLDELEDAEVFVIDRTKNPGAVSLAHDAQGITQIATFIPLMFFLVAALVVLTSMTRMVDEERLDIGTHKALGYSKRRITSKYMIYGGLAAGIGSILGVVVLGKSLPWFIMTSYAISYSIPIFSTPLDPLITIEAIGASIAVALLATWGAAAASLRERPATLMLPKAPKPGKRILLERIRPLWRHLSFSHKVTARNLLRYKPRFFMAVIGIAGCTALLMVGFGLRDAIGSIVSNQYEELMTYDLAVKLDADATEDQRREALGSFDKEIDGTLMVDDFSMISSGNGEELRMEVIVASDEAPLEDFITLRERASGEPLVLDPDTVVITEKAATVLGKEVGDGIVLYDENAVGDKEGEGHVVRIGGITENYLQHYVYMQPALYESLFDKEPTYDLVFVRLAPDADASTVAQRLLDQSGVSAVTIVEERVKTYEDMLDVMNKLIIVVVLLAAALAFVVLYNLTNINITERVREIATLKVLGFTKGEVNAYIFREIIIMAIIGALLGCLLGIPLTFNIAESAETVSMMFGRTIEPLSFVVSFVITVAFTFIVMLSMRPKLAKVDMVESLKSIE